MTNLAVNHNHIDGVTPPDPIIIPGGDPTFGYNLALIFMQVCDKVGISRCNKELHDIQERQGVVMDIQAYLQKIQRILNQIQQAATGKNDDPKKGPVKEDGLPPDYFKEGQPGFGLMKELSDTYKLLYVSNDAYKIDGKSVSAKDYYEALLKHQGIDPNSVISFTTLNDINSGTGMNAISDKMPNQDLGKMTDLLKNFDPHDSKYESYLQAMFMHGAKDYFQYNHPGTKPDDPKGSNEMGTANGTANLASQMCSSTATQEAAKQQMEVQMMTGYVNIGQAANNDDNKGKGTMINNEQPHG